MCKELSIMRPILSLVPRLGTRLPNPTLGVIYIESMISCSTMYKAEVELENSRVEPAELVYYSTQQLCKHTFHSVTSPERSIVVITCSRVGKHRSIQ